jgi:hypothetical protein
VQFSLIFRHPFWKYLLWQEGPVIITAFLHSKKDTVAPVIYSIYCKRPDFGITYFPEIKLPQTATGLYQAGKVYDFDKTDMHRFGIKEYMVAITMLTFFNEMKKFLTGIDHKQFAAIFYRINVV